MKRLNIISIAIFFILLTVFSAIVLPDMDFGHNWWEEVIVIPVGAAVLALGFWFISLFMMIMVRIYKSNELPTITFTPEEMAMIKAERNRSTI